MAADYKRAFTEFKRLLGAEYVVEDMATLAEYEKATFKTDRRIRGVLRPENTEQVQACMKVATSTYTPIYVISTGKNVGYGSRVPTCDDAVIMELSRLNRIVEFNEDLAYVVVEPGVSQEQLHQYLTLNDSKLWMDATGSFPSHSLIGNIADRGFGHTMYADHFDHVGGMEVVLPTGELLKTGFGRFENARGEGVYKWGVGPYVDGLFTQSNLGVIVRATIWLMPAPKHYQKFFFNLMDDQDLPGVIDILRSLRLDGTLKSAMHIGNNYKVLGSVQRFPWDETNGETPLTPETMEQLAKKLDISAWTASGALYGSKAEVKNAAREIRKRLKGKVKKLMFIDERLLKWAEWLAPIYRWITGIDIRDMIGLLRPLFGLTKGIPTDTMIPSTYWRKKETVPENPDPDRDDCGLIWIAPIAPTSGNNARELWAIIRSVMLKHGFEPSVSITLLTERSMDCVVNIAFDRSVAGEDDRALACHDELLDELTTAGFYPYRLSIASMGIVTADNSPYKHLVNGVKEVVDPAGILSPGRYGI